MKKARLDCTILEAEHASIKSTAALIGFSSMKNYILSCHKTQTNLIKFATESGVTMINIPKAIEKMFECQATKDNLKEFFRLFAENNNKE